MGDDLNDIKRSVAYYLGRMRASTRGMPEGEAKSLALRTFDELVARNELDLLAEGPIRDAFLRGINDYGPTPKKSPKPTQSSADRKIELLRLAYFVDGTHNGFNVDLAGNETGSVATNVLKMFQALAGEEQRDRNEAVRLLAEPEPWGRRQAAKYLHGVGNGENFLARSLSGMTGRGLLERVIEGHVFLSRRYEYGASIVLVGFSRGAYAVRALADWIAAKGLLDPTHLGNDDEEWYRAAAASMTAWQVHRANQYKKLRVEEKLKWRFFHGYQNVLMTLPAFFRGPEPKHVSAEVQAVAVWDTVGALGLWNPVLELPLLRQHQNPMRRPDTVMLTTPVLDKSVRQAWHAVSLDEDRVDFTPSLWDARTGVIQRLFPGVHSDVGGGYAQCGLSDIALQWIYSQLQGQLVFRTPVTVVPDPVAPAHRGWDSLMGGAALRSVRSFVHRSDLEIDEAILHRINAAQVQAHARAEPKPYRPRNLPVS